MRAPRRPEPVVVDGLRLHLREAGEGEALLLVHGLGVAGRYLVPLGERLARTGRVLVPDLPGSGRSDTPSWPPSVEALAGSIGALLEVTGHDRAVLVAHSFGCQVAAAFARRHADQVERLVLIGPTVDPDDRSFASQSVRLALDLVREPPSLWPIVLTDYGRMGFRRFLATARVALRDRLEEHVRDLPMPVLVLRGEHDPLTPPDWALRVASLATEGRAETVPGAAHAAHFSHPEPVARLVEAFLAERRDRLA